MARRIEYKLYTKSQVDEIINQANKLDKACKDEEYRKVIKENKELKAKLKQEQERRFTIMKQTIKKIFEDIEQTRVLSFCSYEKILRIKKKWVGKE